jgi:hypothetical protein
MNINNNFSSERVHSRPKVIFRAEVEISSLTEEEKFA